jgi:predicted acetyltransferase
MSITFDIINEYQLMEDDRRNISRLLCDCFSEYPKDRIHFRQVPSFRLIGRDKQGIQAHIAVTFRWMSLDQSVIRVFGLTDICVASKAREKKLATKMIEYLSEIGRKQSVDFLILIAWMPEFYQRIGFQIAHNRCRWLLIQNDESLGLAQRKIENGLMIKALGDKAWSDGPLDFLGPVF